MTFGPRVLTLLVTAVLSASLASCGGESEAEREKEAAQGFSAAADLSTCTAHASAAATPYGDGFPDDWPFPPQTVVFNAEDRGSSGTIVTGISAAPLAAILDHMNHQVVDAASRSRRVRPRSTTPRRSGAATVPWTLGDPGVREVPRGDRGPGALHHYRLSPGRASRTRSRAGARGRSVSW